MPNQPKLPTKNSDNIGKVEPRPIVEEMRTSYLDYAMSVIVRRALPDVRDGLKPVHRRILYAMWQSGLRSTAKFRKCANVVGEVLGKYHPHGDIAVYDSLVRMAQDFSLRYPLIRGQGNFGSLDGDSAAAYRYCVTADTRIITERGLEKIGSLSETENLELCVLSKDRTVSRASKWFDSGIHPTLRITTNKGYKLTGSYNHPVLTWVRDASGTPHFAWKLLENVRVGDVVAMDRSGDLWPTKELDLRPYHPKVVNRKTQVETLPTALNEDLAFILGSLLSEGTLGEHKIEFCNTDAEWVEEFSQRWQRIFPDCRLHVFDRKPSSYGKKLYRRLEIHSHHVISFLRNLGLEPKKSPARQVPEALFYATKPVMAAFLRAFFEGDGSVTFSKKCPQLGCVSTSKRLIDELQLILLRFGLDSFNRYDRGRGTHTLHTRGVENYRLFQKEIGFVSLRKRRKLSELLERFTVASFKTDFVPYLASSMRELVHATAQRDISRYNFDRYHNLAERYERVSTAVTEATDLDFRPYFERLLTSYYLFEPVTEVVEAGPARVYSIKVESECHSFIGNGFINHNTESKLAAIAEEMLFDIDKDTVDFVPNYDGAHKEPTVLPAKLPNLLLNGTLGIAVGMATNIPPHSLGELCDGVAALIENAEISIEDLNKMVKGPDFPTGGIIYNAKDIAQAYATGKGGIIMRAKTEIVEEKSGMFKIVVTEIPYQVNKASLVEQIATLVTDKKIEGIKDLRDESDKDGVRVVVDLKKDAYPKKVLNQLFKMTQLQETFHVNMLAIVDGVPRVLNLKNMLEEFIKHRQVVVRRRTEYDLIKAKERAHILEGLRIALLHIDDVIVTIKKSKDKDEAKINLIKKFKLSDIQSGAILEMRLQSLANLERLRIEQEYNEKMELIKELESILKSTKKMLDIIKKEVLEIKEKYGDERRTQVVKGALGEFSVEDLIPEEPTVVMVTADGYVKRLPPDTFRQQRRGGKGVSGLTTKEEDQVEHLFSTTTHEDLMFFTTRGRCFLLKAYEVPQGSRTSKGQAIVNFLQLAPGEKVSAILPMAGLLPKKGKEKGEHTSKFLVMVTNQGTIKKTAIEEFENVRRSGLIAIKLHDGDDLKWVKPSTGKDDISLVTQKGQSIRFSEGDVRSMGRVAAGVRGIKLKNDAVIGMDVIGVEEVKTQKLELFTMTENGLGKRTPIEEYKIQGRGGSGIRTMHVSPKTGNVVAAFIGPHDDDRDLILISQHGIVVRVPFKSVPTLGRDTQGVRVMRFKEAGDLVSSVTFVSKEQEEIQAELEEAGEK